MSSVFDGKLNSREHFPNEASDDEYLVEITVSKVYHVPAKAMCDDEAIDNAIDTFMSESNTGMYFKKSTTEEQIVEYPNDG